MRREQRRIALAAGALLLVVIVTVGVLLARGGNNSVEPVAVNADPPSTTDDAGTGTAPAEVDEEVVKLSGVDPLTGERVRLADFAGMPVVLNFWASWCPPCRDELPALVQFAAQHPEAAVVGVNLQDVPEGARALQREIGFTFPSIADPDARIAARLGLVGMPTTFFLDERHVIRGSLTGGTDLDGFEQGLALASGG